MSTMTDTLIATLDEIEADFDLSGWSHCIAAAVYRASVPADERDGDFLDAVQFSEDPRYIAALEAIVEANGDPEYDYGLPQAVMNITMELADAERVTYKTAARTIVINAAHTANTNLTRAMSIA